MVPLVGCNGFTKINPHWVECVNHASKHVNMLRGTSTWSWSYVSIYTHIHTHIYLYIYKIYVLSALPIIKDKMMKEESYYYFSELGPRTKPWSTTKGCHFLSHFFVLSQFAANITIIEWLIKIKFKKKIICLMWRVIPITGYLYI